jgi:Reverse transcriptase (RNA-dependent DNA polymerase)
VNWVFDADIRAFFDAMAHSCIIRFPEYRIADKRILRLIVKWLKAGVVEDGHRTHGVCGVPQGAVISPILANIYLHYVFDLWVDRWRRTKASGDVIIVRYADDTIGGVQQEHEARTFLDELKERMRQFELALQPDKTRLIRFGRHAAKQREKLGEGKPETFDFLGFTHFCTRSRKWGSFVIGRKTIKKRMRAKLLAIKMELRRQSRKTRKRRPRVRQVRRRILTLGALCGRCYRGRSPTGGLCHFDQSVASIAVRVVCGSRAPFHRHPVAAGASASCVSASQFDPLSASTVQSFCARAG